MIKIIIWPSEFLQYGGNKLPILGGYRNGLTRIEARALTQLIFTPI
jgi:hypothetical protein